MSEKSKKSVVGRQLILTSVFAGILLLVSNSAIWINRQVFNDKAFTATAVSSITSQSSRDAIAAKITSEALSNHPRIKNVVDDSLIKLISGLLDGDRFQTVLTNSVSRLNIYLTSSHQEDVTINLTGIKGVIDKLVEISARTENPITVPEKLENIPDQIVLIQEKNIPDFYKYGVAMSLLGPLSMLAGVILLAYPYIKNRSKYMPIMLVQGSIVAVLGLVALLIGPIFRPIALGPIQDPNSRIVAGNLYDSFISTFNSQTWALIALGLIACAFVLAIKIFKIFRKK